MSRTIIFFITFIFFIGVAFLFKKPASAQELNCTNLLENAQNYFSTGKYNLIPGYLDACLESGFTTAEAITAYRLITITYLYLDDLAQADSVYTLLLKIDPERKPDPAVDPPDLIFLHNNFRTSPVFATRFYGGINYTFQDVIYDVALFPSNLQDEEHNGEIGGNIGIGIEYNILPQLSIGGEAGASLRDIRHNNTLTHTGDSIMTFIQVAENQFWLDAPFYLKYTIERGRNRPYFMGGFTVNLLYYSATSGYSKDFNESGVVKSFQDPGLDIGEKRDFFNYGVFFGAGILIKLKGINYLSVDLRYNPGLTNVNLPEKRYENESNIPEFSWLPDDIRVNTVSLNIGFFMPQYRPKKIRDNTEM